MSIEVNDIVKRKEEIKGHEELHGELWVSCQHPDGTFNIVNFDGSAGYCNVPESKIEFVRKSIATTKEAVYIDYRCTVFVQESPNGKLLVEVDAVNEYCDLVRTISAHEDITRDEGRIASIVQYARRKRKLKKK